MAKLKEGSGPLVHYHLEIYHEPLEILNPFDHMETRIAATVADVTDKAIVNAILKAARQDGIDDLYLIDKQFISDAIREKMAKEDAGFVQVVRCKDCKHRGNPKNERLPSICPYTGMLTSPDGFCSYGEIRGTNHG